MPTSAMHPVVITAEGRLGSAAVTEWLDEGGWHYQLVAHKPTYRAADEAAASGVPPAHAAKSLVLRLTEGFQLVTIPASERLDLRKVKELLGTGSVRLATEKEIAARFPRFDVGAMPPFGELLGIPEIVDRRLLHYSQVVCSAGDHTHSLVVIPVELVGRLAPRVADVCED